MLRKKALTALLLIALVGVSLFAQGAAENTSSDKKVSIWSFNLSTDALTVVQNEIIPKYEAMHPGVSVEWQNITYNG